VVVRNQVAELVDLAPTIADYLDIPVQAQWRWDGSPLVGSQASPGSTAISDRGGELFMQTGIRDRERAVRYSAKQDQWAYYSLDPEPKEEAGHVLGSPTAEHQQLQAVLQHYMDTAVPPGTQGEELATPEGDELEALQALGYME
jgi:arylsulfatase A-like enzyme